MRGNLHGSGLSGLQSDVWLNAASMSAINRLTCKEPKGGVVTVASPTSVDAFLAIRLILVAFDLPNSTS
jgi:hypothetical protein